jgi:hypothetical protein
VIITMIALFALVLLRRHRVEASAVAQHER